MHCSRLTGRRNWNEKVLPLIKHRPEAVILDARSKATVSGFRGAVSLWSRVYFDYKRSASDMAVKWVTQQSVGLTAFVFLFGINCSRAIFDQIIICLFGTVHFKLNGNLSVIGQYLNGHLSGGIC